MALKGTQFASITSYNYSSMHWVGSYSLLSQDVINNQSTIRLYGSLYNSNEYGYSYGSDDSTLKVNGTTVYSGSYRAYEGYTEMGHTDIVVTHNANGTFPSQTISIYASSYHFNGQSASGTISNIPALDRVAPTVTVSLASRTSNSLTINATASANCDYWEFSRDDGSTFPYTSSTEGTAVSYTFTGLSPNTTYNIKVRARKKVNQLKGTSARGAYTTIGNALLNSVAEVYADASTVIIKPNMTVYGASFTYTLEIKRGNTSILTLTIPAQSVGTKDVSVTLSSAQRTTLLSGMSNVASFSATYILKTLNNGTQVGSTSSATATIRTSSSTSAPSQASFSYADTNAATVAVTGDSTKLVQGQSTLRLTNLTATAKNGASIASYNITIGGVTKSVTSGGTVEMGVISQSGTLSLSVVVTDTRGYTSTRTVSVTSYAYAPPSISAYSVKRNASTSTQIDMSFSGVFSNIGSNTVTATYKYKQSTAGSYSAETSVTPTISGGTFSYSGTNVATFDDEYVYDFVITIADGIITETYYITVPSYNPLMAFRPNGVGFGMIPQNNKSVEVAQDWSVVGNGKYNAFPYLPYSWQAMGTDGSSGYIRIATITFNSTASAHNIPVVFEVVRRNSHVTARITVLYASGTSNDPALDEFYCDNPAWEVFIYRTGTGVWDLYMKKNGTQDRVTVWARVPRFFQTRAEVTMANNQISSIPDGAVMASPLSITNTAKYNTFDYLPYTFNATGTSNTQGYAKIATVVVTGSTWTQTTIVFRGMRRTDQTPFSLYFALGGLATDPPLTSFYADFPIVPSGAALFEAFAYKSASYTWDIYVRKCSGSDQITIWADVPKYAQDGYTITFSQGHQTSIPSGAVKAIQAPVNNLPSSFATSYSSGNQGYLKIAQITITGSWVNGPIVFTVSRLTDSRPVQLSIRFNGSDSLDPTIDKFYYDSVAGTYTGTPFTAFAYKEGTSVWGIYVQKGGLNDNINVQTYVPPYIASRVNIIYVEARQPSVPSGAVMATPVNEWKIIHSASPGGQTLISCTGTLSTSYFRMWEKSNHEEYSIEGRWRITNFARTSDRPGFSFQTNARPIVNLYGYLGWRTDGNSVKYAVPETLIVDLNTSGLMTIRTTETYWNCVSGGSIWLMIPRTTFSYDYNS